MIEVRREVRAAMADGNFVPAGEVLWCLFQPPSSRVAFAPLTVEVPSESDQRDAVKLLGGDEFDPDRTAFAASELDLEEEHLVRSQVGAMVLAEVLTSLVRRGD